MPFLDRRDVLYHPDTYFGTALDGASGHDGTNRASQATINSRAQISPPDSQTATQRAHTCKWTLYEGGGATEIRSRTLGQPRPSSRTGAEGITTTAGEDYTDVFSTIPETPSKGAESTNYSQGISCGTTCSSTASYHATAAR